MLDDTSNNFALHSTVSHLYYNYDSQHVLLHPLAQETDPDGVCLHIHTSSYRFNVNRGRVTWCGVYSSQSQPKESYGWTSTGNISS